MGRLKNCVLVMKESASYIAFAETGPLELNGFAEEGSCCCVTPGYVDQKR